MKNIPEYMLYLENGDYHGLEKVYFSDGSDEVLYVVYEIIKNRLEECGVILKHIKAQLKGPSKVSLL